MMNPGEMNPHKAMSLPANMEAEQALLGILLYDNSAFHFLPPSFKPHHFYEPYHGRLFQGISRTVKAGLIVDAISIHETFRGDKGHAVLGGLSYLIDLVDHAPPATTVASYAATISDLAARREMMRLADAMRQAAGEQFDEDGAALDAKGIADVFQRELTALQIETSREELTPLSAAISGVLHQIDDTTAISGFKTGLAPLDHQLGPMQAGDLILLAGRPSMGKSAVGLAMALNVAAPALADKLNGRDWDYRKAAGVIEIHGEMAWGDDKAGGQTARRHLTDIGHGLFGEAFPTYKAIRDKTVSVDQRKMMTEAAKYLETLPLVGIKRTGLKISTLRSLIRRQITTWDREGIELGMVLIDHVGLLRADGRTSGRYEAQTEIAINLKELADEIKAPTVALVQLSRDIERRDDKRPMLADLRDSGAWEENADAALFVYRDAYYAAREPEPDENKTLEWAKWDARRRSKEIDIVLGKVREGEAGGSAKLWGGLPWNAIRGAEPEPKRSLI